MSLQFSDTTTKNGLIQECESIVFGDNNYGRISNDTSLMYTFTRYINEAMNKVASLIMTADGRWQFDDTNNSDFPIATTDLGTTAGSEQQDYQFGVTFLRVLKVEILDANGNWHLLKPIDMSDIYDQSFTDFLKTPGTPGYYDKTANSIFLYPKPLAANVTSSGGLKVFFQRPPSYFTVTDTTKVPGFNSLYHRLVALMASLNYSSFKQLSVTKILAEMVKQQSDDLVNDYSLRNRDEHLKLQTRKIKYN